MRLEGQSIWLEQNPAYKMILLIACLYHIYTRTHKYSQIAYGAGLSEEF
jgi:hypothetical protein